MKKIIFSMLAISLVIMPQIFYSQNWTPEEETILERVKTGWTSWQDAVNNKDLSIWLDAADPMDDRHCWFVHEAGPRNIDDAKRNFEFRIQDLSRLHMIKLTPLRIEVHENVAFIWFYARYTTEDKNGNTSTFEDKRFEVYHKVDGKWRWSAGMVATEKS